MYKIINNFNQDVLCPVWPQKRMLQRGHDLKFHTQEVKGMCSNFFAGRVIRDWNNIANDIIHAKSINIFKAKLRPEWMEHTELYIFILVTTVAVNSSLYITHVTIQFLY